MKLLLKSCAFLVIVIVCTSLTAKSNTDMRKLIGELSASSAKVRAQSALILGGMRDKSAVFYLIDCLKDPSPVVRGTCARALGMIGDDRGLGPAIQLGNSNNGFVRKWAKWAVRHMVHPDTGLRVAMPEPKGGGTAQMRSAVLDGIARTVLDVDVWEAAQQMDFSNDKSAIEGIADAPAPMLRLQSRITQDGKGGVKIYISGKLGKFLVADITCKISAKDAANMDILIVRSKDCASKLVKRLTSGGKK